MPGQAAEDLRHADRERHRAAGAAGHGLADRCLQLRQIHDRACRALANTAGGVLMAK